MVVAWTKTWYRHMEFAVATTVCEVSHTALYSLLFVYASPGDKKPQTDLE